MGWYGKIFYTIIILTVGGLKNENFYNASGKFGKVAELISVLHRDISVQINKNNPMIVHYISEYGYIPPWVLVNIISLGTLSKFYSLLKQKDQNDIGKYFNVKPHDMQIYLKNLSLARNWCAHDERFFDKRVKSEITSNDIHLNLGIPTNNGKYILGKKDVLSVVIIYKLLLPKKTFNKFTSSLKMLFDNLSNSIQTISISDVRERMGFPTNWIDIKNL
jgi:abortive infection bacteriophage resistance protein